MKIHSAHLAGKILALADFQDGLGSLLCGLSEREKGQLYFENAKENRELANALEGFDQFVGGDVSVETLRVRVFDWQHRTFGKLNTLEGKFEHMKREIAEVLANPSDRSEWADVFILFLGAATVQGLTVNELVKAANDKMMVNEARKWSAPDAAGVCRHVE